MQLIIAPLMNEHKLLTPVYLDNYLIDPNFNKYADMVSMVREIGNSYYDNLQVENASADGAWHQTVIFRKFEFEKQWMGKTEMGLCSSDW